MAFLYKRPNGFWNIIYETNGKRKQISTKQKSKVKANEVFDEWKKNLNRLTSSNILLSEMIDEVIKYVQRHYPRTVPLYKNALKIFLQVIGDKSCKLVNVHDMEYYIDKRKNTIARDRKSFVSPVTINKEIRVIKAAFQKAYFRLKLLKENPMQHAEKIKIAVKKKKKYFTREEIKFIYSQITLESVRRAAEFSLHTGMRLNEVLHAQLNDIDFKERIISIRNKPELNFQTKTCEIRDIPLSDELFNNILKWHNIELTHPIIPYYSPDSFIINYEGNQYTRNPISRKFTKAVKDAGLEGNFHCLRHTFASEKAAAGVDIETLRDLLGHASYETTKIYCQSNMEAKRKAVNLN